MKKTVIVLSLLMATVASVAQTARTIPMSEIGKDTTVKFTDSTKFETSGKELMAIYNDYVKRTEATLTIKQANDLFSILQYIVALKQQEWENRKNIKK